MTVVKEPITTPQGAHRDRGVGWSWLMVPTYALVSVVTSVAYLFVLAARGQREGDLVAMTEGPVAGVVAYQFVDAIRRSFVAPLD